MYLLFTLVGTTLNAQSQAIQDSFELIIQAETNDSLKVLQILKCIENCGFKTEAEILAKTNEAIKIAESITSETLLFMSYAASGSQLSIVRNGIDKAKETFRNLKELATNKNNVEFIARADIGLAGLFGKEGETQQAKDLLFSAVEILKPTQFNELKANCHNELAQVYISESEFESASKIIDSTIALLKYDTLSSQLFSAYSNKGRVYRSLGDIDKAKEQYKLAEKIALVNNQKSNLKVVYNNLGNIEHISGQYDKAIEYYFNSIKIKEELGDSRGLSIGYHNIGAICIDMQDWEKALKNFELSNEIAKDIDFKVLMVHNEGKIGSAYLELGKPELAIEKYNSALDIARQSSFKYGIATNLYRLGDVYIDQKEYLKSNNYLLKALKEARNIKSKPLESAVLVSIAENYIKSPKAKNLNSDSNSLKDKDILQYLLSAKSLSDEMENVENQITALKGLNLFYTTTGNYKENVAVLKEYLDLKDTIFTKDRVAAIADWETKYETARKEKEILKLESEQQIAEIKRKQITYIAMGSGMFLLGLFYLGYLYFVAQSKRKQRKQREDFRSKLSSDLHDDVGTILTGLAMQTELLSQFVPDKLKSNVDNLASMSRDAMGKMRDTVWAIDSRKDTIDDLVHRMIDFAEENLLTKDIQLKFNTNLYEKDVKIEPVIRQNVYLIFKEAVTNILKHSNASIVKVDLISSKSQLDLSIHDNGSFDETKIKTSGTGTSNMKMRTENLEGYFKLLKSDGFKIMLSIPLKKKN